MKRVLIPIAVGILLTVFFFVLAGLAGGACHCVKPVAIFFPYTAIVRGAYGWESMSILLVILQFPVYSITIAMVRGSGWKLLTLLILMGFHFAAAVVGLAAYHHG